MRATRVLVFVLLLAFPAPGLAGENPYLAPGRAFTPRELGTTTGYYANNLFHGDYWYHQVFGIAWGDEQAQEAIAAKADALAPAPEPVTRRLDATRTYWGLEAVQEHFAGPYYLVASEALAAYWHETGENPEFLQNVKIHHVLPHAVDVGIRRWVGDEFEDEYRGELKRAFGRKGLAWDEAAARALVLYEVDLDRLGGLNLHYANGEIVIGSLVQPDPAALTRIEMTAPRYFLDDDPTPEEAERRRDEKVRGYLEILDRSVSSYQKDVAVERLGELGGETAIARLLDVARTAEFASMQRLALEGLGKSKVKRAVPLMLEALEREQPVPIHEAACQALVEIGDPGVVPELKRILQGTTNRYSREALEKAMRELEHPGVLGRFGTLAK